MDIIQSQVILSPEELSFLRQVIDLSTINAKDAKFVANLQIKLENEITQIQDLVNSTEAEKRRQLEEIKSSKKKSS